MATTLLHLRSTTAGAVPTPEQLEVGEIAVNLVDKKWFTKRADGTVVCLNQLTLLDGGEILNTPATVPLSLWRAEISNKVYHWST